MLNKKQFKPMQSKKDLQMENSKDSSYGIVNLGLCKLNVVKAIS